MKISYNAPVTLTYSLIAALVLVLSGTLFPRLTLDFFTTSSNISLLNPLDWLRLVTHVIGHADWGHLIGNLSFILLLGPILEEKYGSVALLIMILLTAVVTGILNALLLSTGLLGGSGIVFMMIMLTSLVNFRSGEVPLTFIAIILLYISRELLAAFSEDSVSQFAHLIGGACGSLFGFASSGVKGRGGVGGPGAGGTSVASSAANRAAIKAAGKAAGKAGTKSAGVPRGPLT